jgi:glycosyltransferase involved in cell wall biosynthesis
MPNISTDLTLNDLPSPPQEKSGWPWTQASQPLPEKMPNGTQWPRISIVTPSYNQGEFIEETIRSVLLQGYPNLEYTIVDGGSTDNSLEIIKKYEKYLSYWVSEPDQGPTDAINKGWQRANGEIIAYLNSDDAYFPGALATIAEAFQQNPQAKAIYGKEFRINKEGLVLAEYGVKEGNRLSLLNLNALPQPATFLKKILLDSLGGMDLNVKYIFDFELCLRISRLNPIVSIPNLLAVTRWHNNTITLNRRSEIGRELVRVIKNEMTVYPDGITPNEKQQILFQVNSMAMNLYLENEKYWQAFKHALIASWFAPSLRLRYSIVKQYYESLLQQNSMSLEEKYFPSGLIKAIHWSSIAQSIINDRGK